MRLTRDVDLTNDGHVKGSKRAMTKRGSQSRKAGVFALPGLPKSPPSAPPELPVRRVRDTVRPAIREQVRAAQSAAPALVTLDVQEHEAAYVVGALIDSARAAEHAQQQWAQAGNTAQAAVFAAKANACNALASRVARAITQHIT